MSSLTSCKFNIKSRDEFLHILRSSDSSGSPISLDVESLFTNVPVIETIDIIIKSVYENTVMAPPNIPKDVLKEMLLLCTTTDFLGTTKVPFRHINGKMFVQKEGVSMDSPLGPTFADYYMCHVENQVLEDKSVKPKLYARYVDDIFIMSSPAGMERLKAAFESHSILKFTHELNVNNKLPFLDVLIDCSNDNIKTSVYHKTTDAGICLNANSECPDRYKISVIKSFLKRAYDVSSDWDLFNVEVSRIKQVLVNNGYTNSFVDHHIKLFVSQLESKVPQNSVDNVVFKKLYYCNQFHNNYEKDQKSS